ncbi:ComEC/Rec2 family competence protein [Providencia manganoxydans]
MLYWLRLFPLSSYINYTKAIRWGIAFIHLQAGLLLLLAPIQIMLFQGINVMSFFANLWLVPIVSWLVIPLILLLFLLPFSFVQHIIFNIIDEIIEVGLKPLAYLSDYWFEMQFAPLFIFLFCWLIGLFIALGLYRYYIGLLGCLAALCIGTENTTRQISGNEWSLTLLDVGHGLAVVIEQKGLAYLYDTGNRWPEGSNAQRQIIPYLKRKKLYLLGSFSVMTILIIREV